MHTSSAQGWSPGPAGSPAGAQRGRGTAQHRPGEGRDAADTAPKTHSSARGSTQPARACPVSPESCHPWSRHPWSHGRREDFGQHPTQAPTKPETASAPPALPQPPAGRCQARAAHSPSAQSHTARLPSPSPPTALLLVCVPGHLLSKCQCLSPRQTPCRARHSEAALPRLSPQPAASAGEQPLTAGGQEGRAAPGTCSCPTTVPSTEHTRTMATSLRECAFPYQFEGL